MKVRIAWLADPETSDSYSASETRVLLRALARCGEMLPLWFAVGSSDPPHYWNGIRVFPLPAECLGSSEFLSILLRQQCPDVVLTNIPNSNFRAGLELLGQSDIPWIRRLNPDELQANFDVGNSVVDTTIAIHDGKSFERRAFVPYIRPFGQSFGVAADASAVLNAFENCIREAIAASNQPPKRQGMSIVMRQQLFCNASVAYVMFELTNALIELGIPVVAQDEHRFLARDFIKREENLFRQGAIQKYDRILQSSSTRYDLEEAITIHFTMLESGVKCGRFGVFPALSGREQLYITGNHVVRPEALRLLTDNFEMILAPSQHVLRPYLQAGLSAHRGAVIPHGVDPLVFSPGQEPIRYQTKKTFKFLQTSFPWVSEKEL